jgi:hypothetical protein
MSGPTIGESNGPSSAVTAAAVNEFLQREFPGTGNRCHEVGAGWATASLDLTS